MLKEPIIDLDKPKAKKVQKIVEVGELKVVDGFVKVTPIGDHVTDEVGSTLWGVRFNVVKDVLVAEVKEKDAVEMIKYGRVKSL